MKYLLFFVCLFCTGMSLAQDHTQVVRGRVIDRDTRQPLGMAFVVLMEKDSGRLGAVSDSNGYFRINNVPVGRSWIRIVMVGYHVYDLQLIVTSGKEIVAEVEMTPAPIEGKEVEISASRSGDQPNNELIFVSARAITPEETNRYPAVVDDVGRIASVLPGVAVTGDEGNEFVIRGNYPGGLLWRLEGVDIPSPNHFTNTGSSGGGIGIVSTNLLDRSDFITGAFPAEYGNALSGVFDLRLRKGNNEKRESTVRAGLVGIDLATEGPIKKGRSSYLINYRYSTPAVLTHIGALPASLGVFNYQDICFKLHFLSGKKNELTVFGVGGTSLQRYDAPPDTSLWENYADRINVRFGSDMFAGGINYLVPLGSKTTLKIFTAVTWHTNIYREDSVSHGFIPSTIKKQDMNLKKSISGFSLTSKLGNRMMIRAGTTFSFSEASAMSYSYFDQQYINLYCPIPFAPTIPAIDSTNILVQTFADIKFNLTTKLSVVTGAHVLLSNINKLSMTVLPEPRLSIRYHLNTKFQFSAGYGLHNQLLPYYYYYRVNSCGLQETYLDPIQSHHFVFSLLYRFSEKMNIKMEFFDQELFSVPVDSVFSVLNTPWTFEEHNLSNSGTGRNRGIEITLDKRFLDRYYLLVTGSFYQSTYTALDGVERNTRYNGNYTGNLLYGKEFKVGKKNNIFEIGGRIVAAGGQRYTPMNVEASRAQRRPVYTDSLAFTKQYKDYFRMDVHFSYRINKKKAAVTWSVDIQNVSNRKNIYNEFYDIDKGERVYKYQLGLIPFLNYRIDF